MQIFMMMAISFVITLLIFICLETGWKNDKTRFLQMPHLLVSIERAGRSNIDAFY